MLEAEDLLRSHRLGDRAIILRLAGLYGPNRIPRMADVVAGKPVRADPRGHLNLVHLDDAVEAVISAESRGNPPRTYLVSDGNPVQRRAFYEHLAELLGRASPQFAESLGDSANQRGANDKKADNRRMLAELDVALRYPSYREGLRRIVVG
jgi:nucleoside-diphosphate-sugar epimerase